LKRIKKNISRKTQARKRRRYLRNLFISVALDFELEERCMEKRVFESEISHIV
jgi:hypothetical protein